MARAVNEANACIYLLNFIILRKCIYDPYTYTYVLHYCVYIQYTYIYIGIYNFKYAADIKVNDIHRFDQKYIHYTYVYIRYMVNRIRIYQKRIQLPRMYRDSYILYFLSSWHRTTLPHSYVPICIYEFIKLYYMLSFSDDKLYLSVLNARARI